MKSQLNLWIYQPIIFYIQCNDVTQTQTWQLIIVGKTKWHRSFKNAAESKYEFVHTELVFYDIKWISSGAFEFEKNPLNTKN